MFDKVKEKLIVVVILSFFISSLTTYAQYEKKLTIIHPLDDVQNEDLTNITNEITSDILKNLDFNENTIWPSDKMPSEVTPQQLLEYGKDPGLGIQSLHKKGYTGKGVNIALFAPPAFLDHEIFSNVDYSANSLDDSLSRIWYTSHGTAAISKLCGKDIGVAPGATVHYYSYLRDGDQKREADLFYEIIDQNKTLPEDKKIRIICLPHGAYKDSKNYKLLIEAEEAARKSGIIVIDVNTIKWTLPVKALPFKDKDNPVSYEGASWVNYRSNALYVPTGGTVADTDNAGNKYAFYQDGSHSWTTSYIVGVITLGLQIDPTLTERQAINYLWSSGYEFHEGKLINPKGFIDMVKKNKVDKPYYYYILYNSKSINDMDKQSIDTYKNQLADYQHYVVLEDVADLSQEDIYTLLKEDVSSTKSRLKGVQIIGTVDDVPTFTISDKADMYDYGIFQSDYIATDYFYGNFDNDPNKINENFSLYEIYNHNPEFNFDSKWIVSRLPLGKGDIHTYFTKNQLYNNEIKTKKYLPLVNFSFLNLDNEELSDDMGQFIKEKLDNEFKVIRNEQYRLYGNRVNLNESNNYLVGDYNKDNILIENKNEINNFVINGPIDSIIDNELGMGVLDNHYYNLLFWDTINETLTRKKHINELIHTGKAINIIASSFSNLQNGISNKASIDTLRVNNSLYFLYDFVKNLYLHHFSWSESFYYARSRYIKEIINYKLENVSLYQLNLNHAIGLNHLGLIERTQDKSVKYLRYMNTYEELIKEHTGDSDKGFILSSESPEEDYNRVPIIEYNQNKIMAYKDNGIEFHKINYRAANRDGYDKLDIDEVSIAVDKNNVYLKLKYYLPRETKASLFELDKTFFVSPPLRSGQRVFIFKLSKGMIDNIDDKLGINVGCGNYVVVEKKVLSSTASIDLSPKIKIDNYYISFNTKPLYINNMLYAPANTFLKALGYSLEWKNNNHEVIAKNDECTIHIINNQINIRNDGNELTLQHKAEVHNGMIMLPVKSIAEGIDTKVTRDDLRRTFSIKTSRHPWLVNN